MENIEVRKLLTSLFGLIFFSGCTAHDPAHDVHIVVRPATTAGTSAIRSSSSTKSAVISWQPAACKNLIANQKSGLFQVSGPCPYLVVGQVSCRIAGDDLYVFLKKPLANDAQFSIMLNVEHYKGPGDYSGARLFILLHEGSAGYRWSNTDVHIKVAEREMYLEVANTDLTGEPARRPCKRIAGERWNYQYECDKIQGSLNAIENTIETVSGRINCAETTH